MALVRKETAGSVSGGYTWDRPGAVIDVPDNLAAELLRQPDGGFTTVPYGHAAEGLTVADPRRELVAGATVEGDPELLDPTASDAPIPAGTADPGGEPPATVSTVQADQPSEEQEQAESERPPAKAAKARARKHVSE